MLGHECPGVVIPDTVLCLPAVNNVLIVNNPSSTSSVYHAHSKLSSVLLLLLLLPEQSRAFGMHSLSILSWTSRCASLGTQMQKGTSINTTRN